tara:strand:+ start:1352 stop:1498 length:147 start_codon:yes stop_codon:yes gene_type:complete
MAILKKSMTGTTFVEAIPKKSRQGSGKHTKYSATSRNKARKRYRGQGR